MGKRNRFWGLLGLTLAPLLAACAPTKLLNAVTPTTGYHAYTNIAYGTLPRQTLDIYAPDKLTQPATVIVFFYGGSWQSGKKEDYRFVAQTLAKQGFVTVVPDYRLYPSIMYPDFLRDSAVAVRWVHDYIARYQGDNSRLFLMGHSAGAYNALMLTANDEYLKALGGSRDWVKGAVGIAGPYDFLPLTDPAIQKIFSPAGNLEFTQPVTYVKQPLPPIFLATGDEDKEVLPRNTLRMANRLREQSSPVVEKIYPGLGHVGIILEFASVIPKDTSIMMDVTNFIRSVK